MSGPPATLESSGARQSSRLDFLYETDGVAGSRLAARWNGCQLFSENVEVQVGGAVLTEELAELRSGRSLARSFATVWRYS
jgi:hypothetical protein